MNITFRIPCQNLVRLFTVKECRYVGKSTQRFGIISTRTDTCKASPGQNVRDMNRSRCGHVFFDRGYATDRGTSKSRSVVSSATTVSTATTLFRDLTIRNDNVLSCVDENTVRVRFLIVKSVILKLGHLTTSKIPHTDLTTTKRQKELILV